jgi:outer membrane receptor for ferrienterochelin and colicin
MRILLVTTLVVSRLASAQSGQSTSAVDSAHTRPALSPALSGFEERRLKAKGGTFFTEEEISRRRVQRLSQLLRGIPGMVIDVNSSSSIPQTSISSMRSQGSSPGRPSGCAITVWVDGTLLGDTRTSESGLDFLDNAINPIQVRGVEVYRTPAAVPPQYQRVGSEMCGTILVWTKR